MLLKKIEYKSKATYQAAALVKAGNSFNALIHLMLNYISVFIILLLVSPRGVKLCMPKIKKSKVNTY